jgi:hypothetical protein
MNCFHAPCANPVAYTFHSGGLCIEHASEARQNAPHLVLTPVDEEAPEDEGYEEELTDPNPDHHPTLDVGSHYPRDKTRPGE